jgi:trehalose 6-phosphate synthase
VFRYSLMRPAMRFTFVLVVGLAVVTWVASIAVQQTTRAWFEKDLNLRAQLVVNGARQAFIAHWHKEQTVDLKELLTEITRDDRILAAAACSASLEQLTRTADFSDGLGCRQLGAHVRPSLSLQAPPSQWTFWSGVEALPGGQVHVSAVPVIDGEHALGFVVLVHDLSFVERREAKTRDFLLFAFAFLALAASAVTIIAARLSWRSWSDALRRFLQSGAADPQFQPILRDVRELVERIVSEKEADKEGGVWTPHRLKQTLTRHLHGERVVILANREPYIHALTDSGDIRVLHPASGLVTALEPVMRACSGTWVAHGGGSADRQTVDGHDRIRVPPGEESFVLRRVWLTQPEEQGYYYGFSNEGLWPLCHIADTRPTFRSEDWKHYQAVNQKFADAVCAEVDSRDPIVLVQDYHFALAPQLIRERLPHATIIMFWHIPWPNSQRFGICPWREELLQGMLGASIIGFHTQFDCNNFVDSVDRFLEARIDREQNAVVQQGRSTLVRPYPISLEWPSSWLATVPPVAECRRTIFADLKLGPNALLGVGVDRLDYTKGIEERLLAVERLLERFEHFRGRLTFVQLAAPSRTVIERYRQLNESVERVAARINERFGEGDYRPIVLLRAHHEPPTVFRYYRAADFCYVSSLHDGMNLVAKEFVASRDDENGVLVLSQFAGAAKELTEALVVNPYDLEEASSALAVALNMSHDEQRDRMRAMRTFIAEYNVYRWAGRMLVDAARLRRRERITGRLTHHLVNSGNGVLMAPDKSSPPAPTPRRQRCDTRRTRRPRGTRARGSARGSQGYATAVSTGSRASRRTSAMSTVGTAARADAARPIASPSTAVSAARRVIGRPPRRAVGRGSLLVTPTSGGRRFSWRPPESCRGAPRGPRRAAS